MAINSSFFNSKELEIGVAVDNSTVGGAASSFTALEVDSVTMPTFNDIKIERRAGAGSGIMVASTDMFHYGKGASIEGSASGFLTDELMDILIPNALGIAESSNTYTVDGTTNANVTFQHGDSSPLLHKTLSFAYSKAGGLDDVLIVPGCIITSLTISGDPNEDGGRMKFDLSFISRTPLAIGSTYGTSAASIAPFSANYVFLGDYKDHVKIDNQDVLLKSFSMTIENPVVFAGFGGSGSSADGAPQTYIRSVPEMSVTVNPVVKYDTNVDQLWEDLRGSGDGTQTATLAAPAFQMSDHATFNDGSATRSIRITDGTVTECAWDEGDYLGLNLSIKARANAVSLFIKHS